MFFILLVNRKKRNKKLGIRKESPGRDRNLVKTFFLFPLKNVYRITMLPKAKLIIPNVATTSILH